MSTKESTERITIANIISIVGIILLLVFTYIGQTYLRGGEIGWSILISIAITGITALNLWLLIKAKGAENEIEKWTKAEYGALAFYAIFAIFTSWYGGVMHFFVVNNAKQEIKKYAKEDLQRIDSLFSAYKDHESTAISITGTGLRNATGQGQLCDESLSKFMENNNIAHSHQSASTFETIQKNKLIGEGFDIIYNEYKNQEAEILNAVDSWSVMKVPSKAKAIEELAKDAENTLSKLSSDAKLPLINYESGRYVLGNYQCEEFSIKGGIDSFKFRKAIREASGISILAIFIVILIHVLILFNYIVAYRTATVGIGKNGEYDGGKVL